MVAPEEGNDEVVGVAKDLDVAMESGEVLLSIFTVIIDGHFGLLVEEDVDCHSTPCCFLQYLIQSELMSIIPLAFFGLVHLLANQHEVGRDHPISDVDIFLSVLQLYI